VFGGLALAIHMLWVVALLSVPMDTAVVILVTSPLILFP
jgi:hypothetical protein